MANELIIRHGLISQGGVRVPFVEVNNTDYSVVQESDYYVEINASSAARTVTLPTPASGQTFVIKNKYDSAYKVTVDTTSGLIDGESDVTLSPGEVLEVTTNGTNWTVLAESGKNLGAGCYDSNISSTGGTNPSAGNITTEESGANERVVRVHVTQNGIDISDLLASFEDEAGLISITDNRDQFASFVPDTVVSGASVYTFTVASSLVNGTLPSNMDIGDAVICFTPFKNGSSGSSGTSGSSGGTSGSGSRFIRNIAVQVRNIRFFRK